MIRFCCSQLKILLPAVFAGALCFSVSALAADAPWDDRYIVRFKQSAMAEGEAFSEANRRATSTTGNTGLGGKRKRFKTQARNMMSARGVEVRHELPIVDSMAVRMTPMQLKRLAADPMVESIETDPPRYPLAQRVPFGIELVQSLQVPFGDSSDTKVCVVDTGFDLGHPDLPDASRVTGESGPGIGSWFQDGTGHGTHVAGSLMALANNEGVIGASNGGGFDVHIYRVFPEEDTPVSSSDVIRGVQSCADAGARIVNLSLGCTGNSCFSLTEQQAFAGFYDEGLLVVAAAGNDGLDPDDGTAPSYPAAYPTVIAVGAVDENTALAGFSQRYAQVELTAPGVQVESTVPRGSDVEAETVVAGQNFFSNPLANTALGEASGVLVDCGIGERICENVNGQICLIARGTVLFADKARNCANGGGRGAIIYNNISGQFLGTLGADNTVAIPVVGVSDSDGARLTSLLGQNATVAVQGADYGLKSGTSMASPHVAGVAALVWSHFPELTNSQLRIALQNGALDLGAPGRDNLYGFGLVQAASTLTRLSSDADSDSIDNQNDNCPFNSNADQVDLDLDATGDACDADLDGDGISNVYESTHGLNPRLADALLDRDGDGFSNLAEFYATTSSSDSSSTPGAQNSSSVVAAVLPSSRSARVGEPVTAFATLINTTNQPGANCSVAPLQPLISGFEYYSTDSQTNAISGVANTPVDVPANGSQSFLLRFLPGAVLDQLDLEFRVGCENLGSAAVLSGVSTLLLSASATPVVDVIALAATASGDGVVRLGSNGAGAFGVASINLGIAAQLTVSLNSTDPQLPLSMVICPTDPAGNCRTEAAAEVALSVAAEATPTFSVFVQSAGPVEFDPAGRRIQVLFSDPAGIVRGSTSVALSRLE